MRYFDRSCLHTSVAVAHLGESQLLSDQTVVSAMLAYEHRLDSTTSLVAQGSMMQSPFGNLNIDRIGGAAYVVDLGVKKGLSRKTVVFAAISENLENLNSSVDVGLHLGVSHSIR